MFLTQKRPLCSLCPLWFKKQSLPTGRWVLLIIFLFALALSPDSALAVTKVVYPVNGTAVKTATVDILGMTTSPGETVTIVLNGQKVSIKPESDGSFTQAVRLKKWWNRLTVDGKAVKVFFLARGGQLPANAVESYPHPAILDGCTDCHEFTKGGGVELAEEGKELCLMCHDDPTLDSKGKVFPTVHSPIADDDDCTSCHGPHQGANDAFNREPVPGLCYECHDSVTEKSSDKEYKNIHGPVDGGYCTECHDPHAAKYKKLLSEKDNELCFQCHDDPGVDSKGRRWWSSHSPVQESCVNCHSPHASDVDSNLLAEIFDLCSGCHDEHPAHSLDASRYVGGEGASGIVSLPSDLPLTFEGMMVCTGCHLPHGSANEKLLRVPKSRICSECHQI